MFLHFFFFFFFFSINIKTESPGFQFIGGNGPYTIFEGIHLATYIKHIKPGQHSSIVRHYNYNNVLSSEK